MSYQSTKVPVELSPHSQESKLNEWIAQHFNHCRLDQSGHRYCGVTPILWLGFKEATDYTREEALMLLGDETGMTRRGRMLICSAGLGSWASPDTVRDPSSEAWDIASARGYGVSQGYSEVWVASERSDVVYSPIVPRSAFGKLTLHSSPMPQTKGLDIPDGTLLPPHIHFEVDGVFTDPKGVPFVKVGYSKETSSGQVKTRIIKADGMLCEIEGGSMLEYPGDWLKGSRTWQSRTNSRWIEGPEEHTEAIFTNVFEDLKTLRAYQDGKRWPVGGVCKSRGE